MQIGDCRATIKAVRHHHATIAGSLVFASAWGDIIDCGIILRIKTKISKEVVPHVYTYAMI